MDSSDVDSDLPPVQVLGAGAAAAIPEGLAPASMPPNARLVGELDWCWSPMHNMRLRYHLCSNRTKTAWLLWSRCYDDNWGRWQAPELAAWMARDDARWPLAGEGTVARHLLEAVWQAERQANGLDCFSMINESGVLDRVEFEEIAERVWREQAGQ